MSSEDLHAPRNRLTTNTITQHQAIVSLREELEAADWYRQRADDCEDAALKAILLHNMREEIEHACMILEWLRRNVPDWAKEMDAYLYSEGSITAVEHAETGQAGVEKPAAHGEAPIEANAPIEATRGAAYRFTVGSLKVRGE